MTRSTSPDWRNGSRLSEIVSFQVMPLSLMPSEPARILPISTSKPEGTLSAAPLKPSPGWSNFTPMVILPESASSFIRVPASKLEAASFFTSTSAPSPLAWPALPPHAAVVASASPARTTLNLVCRICFSFIPGRCPVPSECCGKPVA